MVGQKSPVASAKQEPKTVEAYSGFKKPNEGLADFQIWKHDKVSEWGDGLRQYQFVLDYAQVSRNDWT